MPFIEREEENSSSIAPRIIHFSFRTISPCYYLCTCLLTPSTSTELEYQRRVATCAACNWRRTERTENWWRWEKQPFLCIARRHRGDRVNFLDWTWNICTPPGTFAPERVRLGQCHFLGRLRAEIAVAFWMSNLIIYDDDNKSAPRDNCRAIWEQFTELKLNQVLIYVRDLTHLRTPRESVWQRKRAKIRRFVLVNKKLACENIKTFFKTSTKNDGIITCNLRFISIWDHASCSHNFTLWHTRAKFALNSLSTSACGSALKIKFIARGTLFMIRKALSKHNAFMLRDQPFVHKKPNILASREKSLLFMTSCYNGR